jgi:hypothetical protein
MSPTRIILTVAGLASPGFIMFILYFVTQNIVWGLWCGLLYKNVTFFSFLKTWAKEDIVTGSDASNDSSTGSKGTGSADLFSTEIGLTKRSRLNAEKESQLSQGDQGSMETMVGFNSNIGSNGADSGNGAGGKSESQSSPGLHDRSQQLARRQTLFKGFSKAPVVKKKGGGHKPAVLGDFGGQTPYSPRENTEKPVLELVSLEERGDCEEGELIHP